MAEVARPGDEHRAVGRIDRGDAPRRRASEPPGWAKARTPAARHTSTASGNGKNASEAHAAPTVDAAPSIAWAFATACRAASTREVWPLPIPTSRRSRTSTIAFEVTPRTRRQARSRSSCSSSVGARRVAHVQVAGASVTMSGVVTRTAPPAVRIEPIGEAAAGRDGVVGRQALVDEHAQVRLLRQDLERLPGVGGRDDDLEEDRGERLGHRSVDLARQRHDAAEGADRVRLERRAPTRRAASPARRRRTGSCA